METDPSFAMSKQLVSRQAPTVTNELASLQNLRYLNVVFGRVVDRTRIKQAVVPHRKVLVPFQLASESQVPAYPFSAAEVREIFEPLADQWEEETEFMSMTPQITDHPSYIEIAALGYPAVPLILERLEQRVRPWFKALRAMARENPAEGAETNSEAAEAWLVWGRERGLID